MLTILLHKNQILIDKPIMPSLYDKELNILNGRAGKIVVSDLNPGENSLKYFN